MRIRVAAAKHADDVAQRRAIDRRHDADAAGEGRQRAFARRFEEPLGGQLFLQLLKRELERAVAMRLDVLADQLILALGVVDAHATAHDHVKAILRFEFQIAERRAEHHALDL